MKRMLILLVLLFATACGSDSSEKGDFDIDENADASFQDVAEMDAGNGDPGDAAPPERCLDYDDAAIDFERLQIGRETTRNFVLNNCSTTETVGVASVDLSSEAFSAVIVGVGQAEPAGSVTLAFSFSPVEATPYEATAVINFVDGSEPVEVTLSGAGSVDPVACVETVAGFTDPEYAGQDAINILALTSVELDASASASPAGQVVGYEWSLVSRPDSSNAMLSDNLSPTPELFVDLIGTYIVELTVVDDEGYTSCEPDRVEIRAVSEDPDEFLIRLTWTTPMDDDLTDPDGGDLDLHWRRNGAQWNTPPDDIFWDNVTADWGPPGPTSNPSLDIDDTDGEGPENIRQPEPVDGTNYSIGVHYSDANQLGTSIAVVRLYKGGVLIQEFGGKELEDREFWYVAEVTTPDNVVVVDRVTAGFP